MFSMTFEPQGHGWSRCIITDVAGSRQFTASHVMNDPLVELLNAIADLAEGARESRAHFFEEPGEYRWLFQSIPRTDPVMVRLRVLSFPDWSSGRPDDRGIEEFKADIPTIDLCIAARSMAMVVRSDYGSQDFSDLSRVNLDRIDRYLSRG